ncbi:MAG TPA: leucine-rich repeat domain-containing protein [Flavisolibacter sp.]|nr:leucine-rich repeat domain-containing protein [Flavisolibacter sp.]
MTIDIDWWRQLSQQWKNTFAETCFGHTNEPTPTELAQLFAAPALRFAGPRAPFPNMSFALTDLSGISHLTNLEVLVVIHHELEAIEEVKNLAKLKALFLLDNKISSLQGIENLKGLEQLYVQINRIESLQPVEGLTNLKDLFVQNNKLTSLQGLTEQHADKLHMFVCKPNDGLSPKELMRVERELYIRCRNL